MNIEVYCEPSLSFHNIPISLKMPESKLVTGIFSTFLLQNRFFCVSLQRLLAHSASGHDAFCRSARYYHITIDERHKQIARVVIRSLITAWVDFLCVFSSGVVALGRHTSV